MYRLAELKRLSEIYLAATGTSANALSNQISGQSNNRMIGRILDGVGIRGVNVEAVGDFFDAHWPPDALWPPDVPRHNGHRSEAAE
jgi:hypothetical protein